jgi:sugar phosphate isomerase/epimerase
MKFSICNELFKGWPIERIAHFVAELGYEGLELAPFTLCSLVTDLSLGDRHQIRRSIEGADLKVVGLHWLLAETVGFNLNDADPAIRQRTTDYLLALIDCCADLGGEVLIFGSPQQRNIPEERTKEEAWSSAVEILNQCGIHSSERGVVFCVEPLSRNETNFLVDVSEAANLVRAVDHPNLRMMVDTKAMSFTRSLITDQIRSVSPLFHHVHLNDPNLRGPGMGDMNFGPILQVLNDLSYEDWLSVEVFDFAPGAETTARESLTYLKGLEKLLLSQ